MIARPYKKRNFFEYSTDSRVVFLCLLLQNMSVEIKNI